MKGPIHKKTLQGISIVTLLLVALGISCHLFYNPLKDLAWSFLSSVLHATGKENAKNNKAQNNSSPTPTTPQPTIIAESTPSSAPTSTPNSVPTTDTPSLPPQANSVAEPPTLPESSTLEAPVQQEQSVLDLSSNPTSQLDNIEVVQQIINQVSELQFSEPPAPIQEQKVNLMDKDKNNQKNQQEIIEYQETANTVEITPDPEKIKTIDKLIVENIIESQPQIDLVIAEDITDDHVQDAKLVDATNLKAAKVVVEEQAQGRDLLSCVEIGSEGKNCEKWHKEKDLEQGQPYQWEVPGLTASMVAESKEPVLLLEENNNLITALQTFTTSDDPGKIDVEIAPDLEQTPEEKIKSDKKDHAKVEKILIESLDFTSPDNELQITTIEDTVAQNVIVIDTTNLAAESVTVDQVAVGKDFLSCTDYDELNNSCKKWKKEKDLPPDSTISVTLTSPGKSAFGQSKDGILILDKDYNVIPSQQQALTKVGRLLETVIQLIDLNPSKITAYFSESTPSNELNLNVSEINDSLQGKIISVDLDTLQATSAEVEGIAEGYDLFNCSDFDFETQSCQGKWKKFQNLTSEQPYNFTIKQGEKSQGYLESKKWISLLGRENELLDYDEIVESQNSTKAYLELTPRDNPIKKIEVQDYNENQPNELKIATIESDIQGFAVDPTGLGGTNINLEIEAKGNALMKCKEWDFTNGYCKGTWEKIKTLTPGQTYDLAIDAFDPGFLEINENIELGAEFSTIFAPTSTQTPEQVPTLVLASDQPSASSSSTSSVSYSSSSASNYQSHRLSAATQPSHETSSSSPSCKYTQTSTVPFVDIKNHWAKKYISSLFRQCIISGKDAKHFAPNQTITRAELLKIAVSAFKLGVFPYSNNSFKDVSSKDWFAQYLTSATKLQIITGYSNNSELYFKPNQAITNAEALKVLVLAKKVKLNAYSAPQKGKWYTPYVKFASSRGIISQNTFKPNLPITRGEVAMMVYLLQNASN